MPRNKKIMDENFVPPPRVAPQLLFLFEDKFGRLIPMSEKHALIMGNFMKRYLGAIETDDASILEKTPAQVARMRLKKIRPRDMRKTALGKAAELGRYRQNTIYG